MNPGTRPCAGYIPPEEIASKTAPDKFEEGDVVGLTQAALRIGRLELMTPRLLHHIGHPNEFIVLDAFESGEDGLCLSLWPCCYRFLDRKTGKKRCQGHPAVYFERVGSLRMPQKGDKSSSLILPFLGEVLGFDYQEDESNPALQANILGMKGQANGHFAKMLKKLAEDAKII
jgi:hypothetical protein